MLLRLYRLLFTLATPLTILYLLKRSRQGKEEKARLKERFGFATQLRPNGNLCWIHAASVGETRSILSLLQQLHLTYPHYHFLITTGTVTSAAIFEKENLPNVIHQYVPLDGTISVTRFLKYWHPNVALWVESELWPNLVTLTHKHIPHMAIINGRMSDNSFAYWQKKKKLAKQMLQCFTLCLAQSEKDKLHFETLGAPHVDYQGNLKYAAKPLPDNADKRAVLEAMLGVRPVWVAASTHEGEEEQLFAAHQQLRHHLPDALFILIPRHAHRGGGLKQLATNNFPTALRSKEEIITSETAVYIADTMGELGIFYRLAPIVYMGGSLIPHGGQNPLEPANLHCAIITGNHVFNFTKVYADFQQQQAALMVTNSEELFEALLTLFKDDTNREALANHAFTFMQQHQQVLPHYLAALKPLF